MLMFFLLHNRKEYTLYMYIMYDTVEKTKVSHKKHATNEEKDARNRLESTIKHKLDQSFFGGWGGGGGSRRPHNPSPNIFPPRSGHVLYHINSLWTKSSV